MKVAPLAHPESTTPGRATVAASSLLLLLTACNGGTLEMRLVEESTVEMPEVTRVQPTLLSARGLDELVIDGQHLDRVASVWFGEREAEIVSASAYELRVLSPQMTAGRPELVLQLAGAEDVVSVAGVVEVTPLPLQYVPADGVDWGAGEQAVVRTAATGDLDGDGDEDVVIAGDAADAAALLINDHGVLRDALVEDPSRLVVPANARDVIVADFDGDGALDLLFTTARGEPAVLLVNDGFANFGPGPELPETLQSALRGRAADIDRDDSPDLILADSAAETPSVHLLLNQTVAAGGIRFEETDPETFADAGTRASDVVVLDIEGDGDADAVLVHAKPEHADGRAHTVLRNVGYGQFIVERGESASSDDHPRRATVADCDADGDPDVYLASQRQDHVVRNDISRMAVAENSTLPVDGADARGVVARDLDRDGNPEIVVANHGAQNRLYRSHEDGRMRDETPRLPIARDATVAVVVLDVDENGADDLLFVQESGAPTLLLWSEDPVADAEPGGMAESGAVP